MGEFRASFSSDDLVRGATMLDAWRVPGLAAKQSYADTYRACLANLYVADRYVLYRNAWRQTGGGEGLLPPADWIAQLSAPKLGDKLAMAEALDRNLGADVSLSGAIAVAPVYRAALWSVRMAYRNYRRIAATAPGIITPGAPNAGAAAIVGNPWAIVVGVIGVAGVAGLAWWGTDRNEKAAEVEKFAAGLNAQSEQYIRDLEIRIAHGQPLPPPPEPLRAADWNEKSKPWMWLAAGSVIGGAAMVGGYYYLTKPRAAPTVLNPAPAPPRPRLRTNAAGPVRRRRRKNPSTTAADNPAPKPLVKAHKRASKKCKKCGRVHRAGEHWSHKRGPKRKKGYRKKRRVGAVAPKPVTRRKRRRAVKRRRAPARPPRKARRKRPSAAKAVRARKTRTKARRPVKAAPRAARRKRRAPEKRRVGRRKSRSSRR